MRRESGRSHRQRGCRCRVSRGSKPNGLLVGVAECEGAVNMRVGTIRDEKKK